MKEAEDLEGGEAVEHPEGAAAEDLEGGEAVEHLEGEAHGAAVGRGPFGGDGPTWKEWEKGSNAFKMMFPWPRPRREEPQAEDADSEVEIVEDEYAGPDLKEENEDDPAGIDLAIEAALNDDNDDDDDLETDDDKMSNDLDEFFLKMMKEPSDGAAEVEQDQMEIENADMKDADDIEQIDIANGVTSLAKQLGAVATMLDPKVPLTKKEEHIVALAKNEMKWDSRSAVGQEFRIKFKNDMTWLGCLSNEEKTDFRKKWAQREYDKILKEKVYTKSFQKVDVKKGDYVAPGRLLWLYGGKGDAEAVNRAKKHIEKAFKMGDPWVKYNEMAEAWDILMLSSGFRCS